MHTSRISKSNKQLGIGGEKLRLAKRRRKTKSSMEESHRCEKNQNVRLNWDLKKITITAAFISTIVSRNFSLSS